MFMSILSITLHAYFSIFIILRQYLTCRSLQHENLLNNGFKRGLIGKPLFILTRAYDMLKVQLYVNDVLFGATNPSFFFVWNTLILYAKNLRLSMMEELIYFLKLQM